jgi:hypothetical protein
MVAMHDYFEADLPGELVEEPTWDDVYGDADEPDFIPQPVQRAWDWEPDVELAGCDCPEEPEFDPTPRLYDFEGPARVIPFPGGWEPDPEPPAACALCGEDGAEPEAGLCRICAGRLPKVGGCGLAIRLTAGLVSGDTGPALDHLTACPDCRTFFDRLGELARVADMETSYAGRLPAVA